RLQVPIAKPASNGTVGQPSTIIALILIGLVGGAGLFALANHLRGAQANANQPALVSTSSPSPTPSLTPTPTPAPAPRSENRKPKETPTPEPTKEKKKKKGDSILNKVKKIFGKK